MKKLKKAALLLLIGINSTFAAEFKPNKVVINGIIEGYKLLQLPPESKPITLDLREFSSGGINVINKLLQERPYIQVEKLRIQFGYLITSINCNAELSSFALCVCNLLENNPKISKISIHIVKSWYNNDELIINHAGLPLIIDKAAERELQSFTLYQSETRSKISDETMASLSLLRHVQKIKISNFQIIDRLAFLIAYALKHTWQVSDLILRNNQISDRGGVFICEALQNHPSVKLVNLEENKLGINTSSYIKNIMTPVDATKSTASIKYWILSNNCIGDEGLKHVAEGLKHDTNASEIYLDGNSITNVGAALIEEVLKENSTLKLLSLGDNYIDDSGTIAISNGIKANKTLRVLLMERNEKITDDGYVSLLTAVKESNLSRINIDIEEICEINEALAEENLGKRNELIDEAIAKIENPESDDSAYSDEIIATKFEELRRELGLKEIL